VYDANVMLDLRLAEIYFDEKRVTPDTLLHAVTAAGNDGRHDYQALVISSQPA
jgi:hypothetical protein